MWTYTGNAVTTHSLKESYTREQLVQDQVTESLKYSLADIAQTLPNVSQPHVSDIVTQSDDLELRGEVW